MRKTCSDACYRVAAGRSAALRYPEGPRKPKPERRGLGHRKGPESPLWKGGTQASAQRSRDRFPERYQARRLTIRAIRAGRLVRQPCQVCGETRSEAHHEDYAKPLEVVWLCRRHHWEADRRLGLGGASRGFATKTPPPEIA